MTSITKEIPEFDYNKDYLEHYSNLPLHEKFLEHFWDHQWHDWEHWEIDCWYEWNEDGDDIHNVADWLENELKSIPEDVELACKRLSIYTTWAMPKDIRDDLKTIINYNLKSNFTS